MLINAYYYAPHNHTLLSEHLDADLERMAGLGTHAVSLCVQESQFTNWHQQRLRNVVNRIHAHGMQAHAVPNRWAGLTAGWLDGFGAFTVENVDSLVEDESGRLCAQNEMVSCIHKPKVAQHMKTSLSRLFELFDFDGLIWDEPHSEACYCAYCRAINPHPTVAWRHDRLAAFLDDLSAFAKSLRSGIVVSLFIQPYTRDLLKPLLSTQHIDFLGSDGHIRATDYRMHRMKGTIFDAHRDCYPVLTAAGKKTLFLPEGHRHRDEDLAHYVTMVDRAFALPMDQLLYYYSAHEMSPDNERIFNQATWAAVERVSRAHAGCRPENQVAARAVPPGIKGGTKGVAKESGVQIP